MAPLRRTGSCTDIDFTLKRQFKKEAFRPIQREVIVAALERHDVFVQAATSFGKSLCFQLPAVIDHGITIVVSPLLSLMMNQVEALKAANVDARTLNSTTPRDEKEHIYQELASGHPRIRLLYVTPELCSTDHFRKKLQLVHKQKELARVAVDEAHCISEWGHDFRKDFKRLSWFREAFPDVPIMCLTATANEQVRRDVLATMGLLGGSDPDRLKTFSTTAFRPNLHIEVRFTSDEANDRFDNFLVWLRGVHKRRKEAERRQELDELGERFDGISGIIYTISRGECESLASALREQGIGAQPFHAKLTKEVKEATLARWIAGKPGYDVIVATTAFGMGIDKDNVRYVVHWRVPKSFEGYYQEAGRAGRDGRASYCFLYYSREDRDRTWSLVARGDSSGSSSSAESRAARMQSFQRLVAYCENTGGCRHAAVCRYFGEDATPDCDFACDWHKDPQDLRERMRRGLASEEYVSTQREEGMYDGYDEYD
ncbi:hypothetical protein RB594_004256 [Gaeumannomyces avenae]